MPKPLDLHVPEGEETIEADVCIVGSGAGGSVIAATLAERGMDVVVLDAAGYFNESDFAQLEFKAYQEMFWRGGPTPTADGNVSLVSGTTLGGGTTINWTNCLRTKDWVRKQWASEHGLDGVDGPDFDGHLDAVWSRLGVTDSCSDLNGPQQRLAEACEALDWSFKRITRNTDPDSYDPESAGFLGFGDQSGSKRSADRTWLADAHADGARLIANCRATRVLVEDGRAAGVEAVYGWADPEGTPVAVTVRAPRVVVASGALESPALLLRSEIGGPATGNYLRLHPTTAVSGVYGDDQRAWWGPPQAALCDEFITAETDGYGPLIETAQYAPGLIGSATPWTSGADHKERMTQFRFTGSFVALTRDHGYGSVGVDAAGEAVPMYSVTDEVDIATMRKGIEGQVRLHETAGAHTITALAAGAPTWRRGDDLESYIAGVTRMPYRMGGHRLFSAHQMGTCRMGQDPETSVADPRGELHDTKGVWIGDASAFPTPSGTNPMITIMALARRTAEAIAEDAGAAGRANSPRRFPLATEAPAAPAPGHPAEPIERDRSSSAASGSSPPARTAIEVLDSTTEQVIGRVPEGTPEDVDRAVAAARKGFEAWSAVPFEDRLDALQGIAAGPRGSRRRARRPDRGRGRDAAGPVAHDPGGAAGDGLRRRRPRSRGEIVWEEQVGQLAGRARADRRGRRDHALELPAAPALRQGRSGARRGLLGGRQAQRGDAAVAPSCWPRSSTSWGCRPASSTSSPASARSSAPRSLPTTTSTWSRFTGSTRAGRMVTEEAAKNVKRVSLELGGKSANVILDDADLKQAVSYGVANCFLNSGQTCSAHTRMLVPREKLAEAEAIASATAEMMAPGDPFEEGSRMGPLVSDAQRDARARVHRQG